MTSEEFIKRIQIAVYASAIEGAVSFLETPPGRRPSAGLTELSEWYNRLTPEAKDCIRRVIQLAVRKAVFGMLAVLDGERPIREAGEAKGALELHYHTEGQSVLLNDPDGETLHDLFAEQVPPL